MKFSLFFFFFLKFQLSKDNKTKKKIWENTRCCISGTKDLLVSLSFLCFLYLKMLSGNDTNESNAFTLLSQPLMFNYKTFGSICILSLFVLYFSYSSLHMSKQQK